MSPKVPRGCWSAFQQRSQPGVKDHRERKLGVCSPLQLPRRPGPSGTRAWYWLWSYSSCCSTEVLSCLALLPPCREAPAQLFPACFSLQGAPFHTGHLNPFCPSMPEQVEPPPAERQGLPSSAPSVLPAATPAQSRLLDKAKGTQGMEQTAPETLVLVQCCASLGYQLRNGISGCLLLSCAGLQWPQCRGST